MRFSIILGLIWAAVVNAYSNPGAVSGYTWAHDPAVIQRVSDGKYFRFNTGGGIGIATASSIAGPWTYVGDVIATPAAISLSGNTDLWAPDVHYLGGTYYLYYAVSTFGSQTSAIGVASSTTLEYGSWTDHGAVGVASDSTKSYNAIDPNFIVDQSGVYHLNFGSFWGDIYQVEMSSNLLKRSTASSYNIEYNSTGTHPSEGSFMFYYSGYSTGGFVDKNGVAATAGGGSVLLASHGYVYGPGGQGVYTDSTYGLVLYYHYADTDSSAGIGDGNYFFGWNVLTWSSGWPVV